MTDDRARPDPVGSTTARRDRPRARPRPWPGGPLRLRFGPGAVLDDALFTELAAANDLRLERTAAGDLEIMTPAGFGAASRNFLLTYRLGCWSEAEGRGLGVFGDSSAGFVLPGGAIRSPDASWVALARWEALSAADRSGFAPLCPDFAAELRSPTDRLGHLRRKLREYRAAGARLGWLLDPRRGAVEVYRPGRPLEVLDRPARLSGEDVLPGLVLDLKGILDG